MWDLVPRPGIKPGPPSLGAWNLNHCATREVPSLSSFVCSLESGYPVTDSEASGMLEPVDEGVWVPRNDSRATDERAWVLECNREASTSWLSLELTRNSLDCIKPLRCGAVCYRICSLTNSIRSLSPNFEASDQPPWISKLALLMGETWPVLKQNSTKKYMFRQKYFP